MPRFRLLALVSAVIALVAVAPARAYTPATSPGFFGVNGTYLGAYDTQPTTLDTVVASMQDQGVGWARIIMSQYVSERQEGVFNWGQPDLLVGALARHGIRPAPLVVGTAPWAADPDNWSVCGSRSYPADVPGWADWVAAAVKRYGSTGTFWASHPELPKLPPVNWEIGNEPNFGNFWCPGANPEQYASVYSASAAAVEAADPPARAIVGGLMGAFGAHAERDLDVPTFLHRMIAAAPELRDQIPAVGIHPYEATPARVLTRISQYRQALREVGMGSTPMIVTEVGWRTAGPLGAELTTEEERTSRIAELASELWRTDCGLQGMAPFSWVTAEQDQTRGDQWFGLADPGSGEPYPSGLAYGRQIQIALGRAEVAPQVEKLSVCGPTSAPTQPAPSPGSVPGPEQSIQTLHQPDVRRTAARAAGEPKSRKKGKRRKRARRHR